MTFDGDNLRVILESGVTTLDAQDFYSRWKDFAKTNGNAKYPLVFLTDGGNPVLGALDNAPYFFFQNNNGWRIRPPEEDINILVTGNLVPQDDTLGTTGMVVPTLGAFTTLVVGIQPITQKVDRVAPLVWAEVAEAGLTYEEMVRLVASVMFGISSGGGGTEIAFRDFADLKDRIRATVDANGNRTGFTTRDGT